MGISGVFIELGNWETTALETCPNEGLKGSSLKEGKPKEIIPVEGAEGVALSGVVALSGEVTLPEEVALSDGTMGTLSDGTMGTNTDE